MNIYSNNKRQYTGLLEHAAAMARGWKTVTFIAIGVSALCVGGVIWMGQKSSIEPVLVVMDEKFIPVGLYRPRTGLTPRDDRVVQATLAQFAVKWRTVSIDKNLTEQHINDLRFYLEGNSAAYRKIRGYLDDRSNNPLERAKRETVSIRVRNVIRIHDLTWRISWVELVAPRGSVNTVEKAYEAIVTFAYLADVPPEVLLANPTGIVIQAIDWEEVQ